MAIGAALRKRRKSGSPSSSPPPPPSFSSATIFQPPLPSLIFLLPPASRLQWPLRLFLLSLTVLISFPLIFLLVPLSIIFLTSTSIRIRHLAPLPLHPHNLPPYRSHSSALIRGWWIYGIGSVLWALTSSGNAPEYNPKLSRWITRAACRLAEWASRYTDRGRLDVQESKLPAVPDDLCVGALGLPGLKKEPVTAFWLRHVRDERSQSSLNGDVKIDSSSALPRGRIPAPKEVLNSAHPHNASPDIAQINNHSPTNRHAILFLAGGGYVTAFPLVHPLIFSLSLSYPADQAPLILAPDVRKSLDLERSFPIPLLDALAGYVELRNKGYEPESIVLLGDSAGAGLTWSLISYLAVWRDRGKDDGAVRLGVPGKVVLVSPWLSLPPTVTPPYPDVVDEPMLLGATRCYLARFPAHAHRPDPFVSDIGIWLSTISRHARHHLASLSRRLHANGWPLVPYHKFNFSTTEDMAAQLLEPKGPVDPPQTLLEWLDPAIFTRMSSHHPFVSPCTDSDSPFVQNVLSILADNGTKLYVQAGTAEWFYTGGAGIARAAKKAGVNVVWQEEKGGFHVEACVYPAEWGGAPARLLAGLREWLDVPT